MEWGLLGLRPAVSGTGLHVQGACWALRVPLTDDPWLPLTVAREAGAERRATLLGLVTLPPGSIDGTAVAAGVRRALVRSVKARSSTLFSSAFPATRALAADLAAALRHCNLHEVDVPVDLGQSGQVGLARSECSVTPTQKEKGSLQAF